MSKGKKILKCDVSSAHYDLQTIIQLQLNNCQLEQRERKIKNKFK